MAPPPFIRLADALDITCHDTVCALRFFIIRWNKKHPEKQVRKTFGKVEVASLKAAWEQNIFDQTPGSRIARAVVQQHRQERSGTIQHPNRQKAAPAQTGTASIQKPRA